MIKHIIGYGATALVALGLGGLAVGGASAAPAAQAQPSPQPTVTATVTAEPLPAETVTETVTEVPAVCLDALDAADTMSKAGGRALTLAGEALGEVPNLIDAMLAGDIDELDRISSTVGGNSEEMSSLDFEAKVSDYVVKRDECRSQQG